MAEEVKDTQEEGEETQQTTDAPADLSEADQDRIFDEYVEPSKDTPKEEVKPVEEKPVEQVVKPEDKPADKPVEKPAVEEKPVVEEKKEEVPVIEEKPKAEEQKASEPVKYEELMPALRTELASAEVPVIGADGKPTGEKAKLSDLLDTYGEDVVPLVAAIINSKAVRDTLKVSVPEQKASEMPKEASDQIAALTQRQVLMDLCMSLSDPEYGGHSDAYRIATSPAFSEWLGKQADEIKQKANTGDIESNRTVLEAYKKDKGLMKDPIKEEQIKKNVEEEEILGATSSGTGRGSTAQKGTVSDKDLDAVFEEEAAK